MNYRHPKIPPKTTVKTSEQATSATNKEVPDSFCMFLTSSSSLVTPSISASGGNNNTNNSSDNNGLTNGIEYILNYSLPEIVPPPDQVVPSSYLSTASKTTANPIPHPPTRTVLTLLMYDKLPVLTPTLLSLLQVYRSYGIIIEFFILHFEDNDNPSFYTSSSSSLGNSCTAFHRSILRSFENKSPTNGTTINDPMDNTLIVHYFPNTSIHWYRTVSSWFLRYHIQPFTINIIPSLSSFVPVGDNGNSNTSSTTDNGNDFLYLYPVAPVPSLFPPPSSSSSSSLSPPSSSILPYHHPLVLGLRSLSISRFDFEPLHYSPLASFPQQYVSGSAWILRSTTNTTTNNNNSNNTTTKISSSTTSSMVNPYYERLYRYLDQNTVGLCVRIHPHADTTEKDGNGPPLANTTKESIQPSLCSYGLIIAMEKTNQYQSPSTCSTMDLLYLPIVCRETTNDTSISIPPSGGMMVNNNDGDRSSSSSTEKSSFFRNSGGYNLSVPLTAVSLLSLSPTNSILPVSGSNSMMDSSSVLPLVTIPYNPLFYSSNLYETIILSYINESVRLNEIVSPSSSKGNQGPPPRGRTNQRGGSKLKNTRNVPLPTPTVPSDIPSSTTPTVTKSNSRSRSVPRTSTTTTTTTTTVSDPPVNGPEKKKTNKTTVRTGTRNASSGNSRKSMVIDDDSSDTSSGNSSLSSDDDDDDILLTSSTKPTLSHGKSSVPLVPLPTVTKPSITLPFLPPPPPPLQPALPTKPLPKGILTNTLPTIPIPPSLPTNNSSNHSNYGNLTNVTKGTSTMNDTTINRSIAITTATTTTATISSSSNVSVSNISPSLSAYDTSLTSISHVPEEDEIDIFNDIDLNAFSINAPSVATNKAVTLYFDKLRYQPTDNNNDSSNSNTNIRNTQRNPLDTLANVSSSSSSVPIVSSLPSKVPKNSTTTASSNVSITETSARLRKQHSSLMMDISFEEDIPNESTNNLSPTTVTSSSTILPWDVVPTQYTSSTTSTNNYARYGQNHCSSIHTTKDPPPISAAVTYAGSTPASSVSYLLGGKLYGDKYSTSGTGHTTTMTTTVKSTRPSFPYSNRSDKENNTDHTISSLASSTPKISTATKVFFTTGTVTNDTDRDPFQFWGE